MLLILKLMKVSDTQVLCRRAFGVKRGRYYVSIEMHA